MLWVGLLLLLLLTLSLKLALLRHSHKHIVSPTTTSWASSIAIITTEGRRTCCIADANVRGERSWTAVVVGAEVFTSGTGSVVVPAAAAEPSAVAAAIVGILDA
jgi:hypothetical protein